METDHDKFYEICKLAWMQKRSKTTYFAHWEEPELKISSCIFPDSRELKSFLNELLAFTAYIYNEIIASNVEFVVKLQNYSGDFKLDLLNSGLRTEPAAELGGHHSRHSIMQSRLPAAPKARI